MNEFLDAYNKAIFPGIFCLFWAITAYACYSIFLAEQTESYLKSMSNGERLVVILFAIGGGAVGTAIFLGPIVGIGYLIYSIPFVKSWLYKPAFPEKLTLEEMQAKSDAILKEIEEMTDSIEVKQICKKHMTTSEILEEAREKLEANNV